MTSPDLSIDAASLLGSLEELAAVNRQADGGCRRVALTDADRLGRDLLVRWMRELDLDVRVDQIGNIFGTYASELAAKPIMIGSHIDTVSTGGWLDGSYGVIAGLEVIRALKRHGIRAPCPLIVASFTNEEGVRFQPDMMGSLVHAGGLDLQVALASKDRDGIVLGDELKRIGYAGEFPCGALIPQAYVELHIEQGTDSRRRRYPVRGCGEPAGYFVAANHDLWPSKSCRNDAHVRAQGRRAERGEDHELCA